MGLVFEPIDIRKYEFLPMPVREQWGALVPESSPLARKDAPTPEDLAGLPLVTTGSDIAQSALSGWLGRYQSRIHVMAAGNLLYNEALLARSCGGAAFGLRLDCRYDGLRFIPLAPALETGTALAWKKEQPLPAAASAFIAFAKKYVAGISQNKI